MNTRAKRNEHYLKKCSFTGYRPQKMPFGFDESDPRCVAFKAELRNTLEELIGERYVYFLSGGSLGMDMFAAEAILELQKDYPWISLEIVTPFDAQAARWAPEYRERHDRLLKQADAVTPICHEYTRSCMFRRNRYLVDEADLLLAAFDGKPGGTAMTVEYANRNRVPIKYIVPHA